MASDRKLYLEVETVTGRKLGVINDEQHGLFKIAYVDGKGGALPTKLQGRFTGVKFAQLALDAFVQETRDVAAEHSPKPRKQKAAEETVAV